MLLAILGLPTLAVIALALLLALGLLCVGLGVFALTTSEPYEPPDDAEIL